MGLIYCGTILSDCSAKASSGELDINQAGLARYEAYIKAIGSQIESYPDVTIVIGLETDSVGNRT